MTEIATVFAINVLTSILKRWIEPKWGKLGTQVTVFILALIGGWYIMFGKEIITLSNLVGSGIALFSLSVALYEVLLKHIGVFKGNLAE